MARTRKIAFLDRDGCLIIGRVVRKESDRI